MGAEAINPLQRNGAVCAGGAGRLAGYRTQLGQKATSAYRVLLVCFQPHQGIAPCFHAAILSSLSCEDGILLALWVAWPQHGR
jgi:hypothetical protein